MRHWCVLLVVCGLLVACIPRSPDDATPTGDATPINKLTFHVDPQRTGWNPKEVILTPDVVSGPLFGRLWRTPQFDRFAGKPPRLFAAPLYVDGVEIHAGSRKGQSLAVLYAVTTAGYVYAVNAFATDHTPAGALLWRRRLTERPCFEGAFGNLGTPVIDLQAQRLYVTSCDDQEQWRAHALDIRSGQAIDGWPVRLDHTSLNAPGINKNGSTRFPETLTNIQRGALNLSADGSRLYVTFGGDGASGWIAAIDTVFATVAAAFSSTAITAEAQGGMWSSSGPSIDGQGRVYIATGASIVYTNTNAGIAGVFPDSAHNWGQSIIQLTDSPENGFALTGTYTPFNYCQTAAMDIDLGSSGTVVIDLDPATTNTPYLLALGGGKQGNVYLLNREAMPGSLTKRQPCGNDSASDLSLLSPKAQPQFGQPGPINVFGPYSDDYGLMDQAKSRSTLAYFRDKEGENYLFVTGSSKREDDLSTSVPPGLVRLKIIAQSGKPAYLAVDQREQTQTFHNPGSPIVTSHGGKDAIVWVLDTNAPRSTPLYGPKAPEPVLYAFDALTFKLLWKSAHGQLSTSGKYNEPTIVRGTVFVGTDRIEAFGLRETPVATKTEQPINREIQPESEQSDNVMKDAQSTEAPRQMVDGARLYRQRCAMCHSTSQTGVPTKQQLTALSQHKIADILLNGAMQTQAFGLSRAEVNAIAAYLAQPVFGKEK